MTVADRAASVLRLLEPERAHELAIRALQRSRSGASAPSNDLRLGLHKLGLSFPNPVGLAAGFDKNGAAIDPLLASGFGFVEVGTVTPLPQAGNPRPRLFRLAEDGALINRLGFNNDGHEAMLERLDGRKRSGIVGVNIGANRDSEDRLYDYVAGVRLFAPDAAYIVINVSSPNTPGLREFEQRAPLTELLARTREARIAAGEECGRLTPLLLKISPELKDRGLAEVIEAAGAHGVDGLIIANTTTSRPRLRSKRHAAEIGGLSGRPVLDLSTSMLARARQLAGPDLVLVGVGGVDGEAAAWSKIAAGADLVQLYTGLIYEGPSLPRRITAGLARRLDERNFSNIQAVRGVETERWAAAWSGLL